MLDRKEKRLRMEEAIKIIRKNSYDSLLSMFFSYNIVNMITDPERKEKKFSIVLSVEDLGKGINGSKSFICLAFKTMLNKIYNGIYSLYSFSFVLLDGPLFRFDISIDGGEIRFIEEQFAEFFSSLKRKIIRDLTNDKHFLRRDLRNGVLPSIDYFAPRNKPFNHIVPNCIVNYFEYRSVNLKLYRKILYEIVEKQFPHLMTEQFKLSYRNK